MNNKCILVLLFLVIMVASGIYGEENNQFIGVSTGYFFQNDNDTYPDKMTINTEIGIIIPPRMALALNIGYFSSLGTLSFTGEETRFTMIPLSLTAEYKFFRTKIKPYIGAKKVIIFYNESNIIERMRGICLGFMLRLGGLYQLGEKINLNLSCSYIYSGEISHPLEGIVNMGGISLTLGIRYQI
ncbi:hypothetical protein ACFLRB_03320 [Acidobacteriota bacterium]